MTRGLEGRAIFLDDADRRDLLDRLCELLPESGMRCFAWALMSNHLHLVVQTGAESLSRVMKRLNTGYATRFNLRHARRGYLFQDRFKSRLVGGDDDLLGVIRYVHRNPLTAGIVGTLDALAAHAWCGYGALIGERSPLPFESVSDALALFASDPGDARRRWRTWMAETLGGGEVLESARVDVLRDPLPPSAKLGAPSAGFASGVPGAPPAIHDLCRQLGLPLRALRGNRKERRLVEARSVIAYVAVARLRMSGLQVAAMLGISGSSVSKALARGRKILEESRCELRV
jgi:REP element-mobilizing transposase RayT